MLTNEEHLNVILTIQQAELRAAPKLDIKCIERISLDTLKKNFGDFSKCEGQWKLMKTKDPIEQLKETFARLRQFNAENYPEEYYPYYEEEVFINRLLLGKTVEDMFNVYRIRTDAEKCPICGSSIFENRYALSRRDNVTHLCPECGQREAIEDFTEEIDG